MRTKMNNKNKGNLLWGLGALRLQYWAGFLNFGGIRNKRHFLCNITTKQGGKGVGGSPLFGTLDIFGAFSILFFIQVRGGRQGSSSPPPSPQSFIGWGLKTLPAENPQIGQDNLYSTTTATTTTGGNPKWGLSENRRLPVSILMLRKLLSQQTWDKLRRGFFLALKDTQYIIGQRIQNFMLKGKNYFTTFAILWKWGSYLWLILLLVGSYWFIGIYIKFGDNDAELWVCLLRLVVFQRD